MTIQNEARKAFLRMMKEACKKNGHKLSFDTELSLSVGFDAGWAAVADRAFESGVRSAQAEACAAIGAMPVPPEGRNP